MPNPDGELLTKERFLEEIICLENRVDSKIHEIKATVKDIEQRQKKIEDTVFAHVVEDENSHVDEDVEKVKEKIYDPEKGIIVMQQSICLALERLHEEFQKSDKLFQKKQESLSKEQKKLKKRFNEKFSSLQKTLWAVVASAAGIYLIDNPSIILKYLKNPF
jgi:chromosome segregation ATPase